MRDFWKSQAGEGASLGACAFLGACVGLFLLVIIVIA